MSPARRSPPRIYVVMVRLSDVGPAVWRRLRISSGATLWRAAGIIAVAMDWPRGRPFIFTRGALTYQHRSNGNGHHESVPELRLRQVMHDPGDVLEFEYGAGEAWHLTVRLEGVLPAREDMRTPWCVGGAGESPHVDVGGPWGYDEWRHEGLDEAEDLHETGTNGAHGAGGGGGSSLDATSPAVAPSPGPRFNVDLVNAGLERLR